MTSLPINGLPIVATEALRDGDVLYVQDPGPPYLLVGTRPLTEVELAGKEARSIVQNGLADVLEWLGEPPPTPYPPRGGRYLLDTIAQQARRTVWHDPTYGRIDRDILEQVDAMNPSSLGQRAAIEETLQNRRNRANGGRK